MRLGVRPTALLFALVALIASGAAVAACPGDAGEPLPPREKLEGLDQQLLRMAGECGKSAGYLAYRGAVLNALGRPGEAALLLEQALMIDPQRAGTQVDYAEALAALGDTASATAMYRDLLARSDVPPLLRPQLQRRLNAIEALSRFDSLAVLSGLRSWAGTGWEGAGSLTFKLGRDSNLNSAPAHDTLNLTLSGGDALFALSDRFRPRAGDAAIIEATGQAARAVQGGAALQLYADARIREAPSVSDTDYRQVQVGGNWGQPLAGGGYGFLGLGVTRLNYGGSDLYHSVRLGASRDWASDRCRPSVGAEAEWRSYPTASELEGRYLGLNAGLACIVGLNRLALRARSGVDSPQADRPGGSQHQSDFRVVWNRPLGPGRIAADLLLFHQRDGSGYSPLLENGVARRINRAGLYLEYTYPVTPSWAALASVEGLLQRSNLDLFDITGNAFFLGLRWTSAR